MMIYLNKIGKRFHQNWIFKGLDFNFKYPEKYAILGHNGSGKSTLIRIAAGMQEPTVGKCIYKCKDKDIAADKFYNYISYCAPGLDVVEELTLKEFFQFHFSFKPIKPNWTIDKIIDSLDFRQVQNRYIHGFSSGMKQRVKLAQAFYADTPVLLLDEPCSNLDEKGIQVYEHLLEHHSENRLVLIASNNEREYKSARCFLQMEDFHPKS